MKGNDPSHSGFARDPSEGEWETSPDRLVLEGLSGLEEAFRPDDDERDVEETPQEADAGVTSTADVEAFRNRSGSGGFRTAREMRAAQERFAAQRRSAARLRDGSATQGFDRDALESDPSEFQAPSVQAKPLSPASLPEPTHPGNEPESGASSDVLPRRPGRVRLPPPRRASLAEDDGLSEESLPASHRSERPPRPDPERPRRSVPASRAAAPAASSRTDRQFLEADPVEHTRQRRERSAFLPAVITSALLTSLLWAGLLWAFWSSFGQQWLEEEIDGKARSLTQALDAEMSSKLENVPSMTRVLELGSDYTLLDARFTNWVRLQALQASLWRTHSRATYDEMLEAGKTLGSPEARAWFDATKRRTEDAYVQRIRNHPGLDIKTLFAGHRGKQEADLGKEDLLMLLLKEDAQTLDRARVAYLLRRFEGEEDVVAALLDTASSGTNLHVVLAAWDSLVALTDYAPPEQGFDRDHLLRWWNLRGEEASP